VRQNRRTTLHALLPERAGQPELRCRAKLPLFEPADSARPARFTLAAFELSEEFDTPVFLRTTTPPVPLQGRVWTSTTTPPPPSAATRSAAQPPQVLMIPATPGRAAWRSRTGGGASAEAVETTRNRVRRATSGMGVITIRVTTSTSGRCAGRERAQARDRPPPSPGA
jgi:indolepyruvate ferredoxin oxidoreductase alpha subunit